jgi:hypothetical protein
MKIDIKHKHAGHLITIEGRLFKANDTGMWNLTEVWQTLKLPKGKQPGQWRTKEAERLERMHFVHSLNKGRSGSHVLATKRAALEYAGWVSSEFKDMVYDAFEAVLEVPEIAQAVANKMRQLGYDQSAALLEREKDIRSYALKAINRGRTLSPAQKERQRINRRISAEASRQRKAGCEWH